MIKLPCRPGWLVTAIASIWLMSTLSRTWSTTFGTAWAWLFMATVGKTPPNLAEDCLIKASARISLLWGLKNSFIWELWQIGPRLTWWLPHQNHHNCFQCPKSESSHCSFEINAGLCSRISFCLFWQFCGGASGKIWTWQLDENIPESL